MTTLYCAHVMSVLCASSIAAEDIESAENSGDHEGDPVSSVSAHTISETANDLLTMQKHQKHKQPGEYDTSSSQRSIHSRKYRHRLPH